jgi:adenylate cyclase
MSSLLIRIYERGRQVYWGEFDAAVELGRQTLDDPQPFMEKQIRPDTWRLVIARHDEATVSRWHARATALTDGKMELENLRDSLPLYLENNRELAPKTKCEVTLPFRLRLRDKDVHFLKPEAAPQSMQTMAHMTIAPGALPDEVRSFTRLPAVPDVESLLRWLQAAIGVLHSASATFDFLNRAARAVVDLVGLDSCGVVMHKDGDWTFSAHEQASYAAAGEAWRPSRQILSQVHRDKRTIWLTSGQSDLEGASLADVKAVVAAPILNPTGEVIGVLYGDRRLDVRSGGLTDITKIEAMLVELLACSVAAGLARVEQEKAALFARIQFEQFFTPELSRLLAERPNMLEGRDAEVTILFCDVRGFSRISSALGPAKTGSMIFDVLGALSDCVIDQAGVLVDYIGDSTMAMWGAPEPVTDHASRACRAGLAMIERMPQLNERWQTQVGEPLVLGIGINTGIARVGNTGSYRKFKYGALGGPVNLASRVEGATKHWRVDLLATAATARLLSPEIHRRRLGTVRVVNIEESVDLFQIVGSPGPKWEHLRQEYEKALGDFEAGAFEKAAGVLTSTISLYPNDAPSRLLLARVNKCVANPSEFSPVWELTSK